MHGISWRSILRVLLSISAAGSIPGSLRVDNGKVIFFDLDLPGNNRDQERFFRRDGTVSPDLLVGPGF